MGKKYINEEAKVGMRWILVLWDENRQTNSALPEDQRVLDEKQLLPSFMQYDKDPRTPKANSLAQYFTSYGDALKEARYYDKHRDELEPAVVVPSNVTKPRTKAKPKQKTSTSTEAKSTFTVGRVQKPAPKPAPTTPPAQSTPQKAPETPSAPKTEPTTVQTPKTQPTTYNKVAPYVNSVKDNGGIFKLPRKKPRQSDTERVALTQSLGDLIPDAFLKYEEDAMPEPAPTSEPEQSTPVEPAALEATPPEPTPIAAEPEPEPQSKLINYYPGKIAFISEDFYQGFHDGKFKLGSNYPTLGKEDGSYATAPSKDYEEIEVESIDGRVFISVTTDNLSAPYLVKDGHVHAFPDPKPGHFLLVERSVAEAARESGRETDDLLFPRRFIRTFNGIVLCSELGKL